MAEEAWRPVVGYEGWYEVSDLGRIRRARPGKGTWVGRILRAISDKDGYLQLSLAKDGVIATRKVHHLVAEAFIGPRPEGQEVNHLDARKENNRADNLEYQTPRGNLLHAYESGAKKPIVGSGHSSAKLSEEDVVEIRRLHGLGERQSELASRFGVSRTALREIVIGKTWKHVAA